MKNDKNALMSESMSKNQMSPGLADPRDFEVIEAGDNPAMSTPYHGQCGGTNAEYEKLLHEGERAANASSFADEGEEHPNVDNAGKPHTDGFSRDAK